VTHSLYVDDHGDRSLDSVQDQGPVPVIVCPRDRQFQEPLCSGGGGCRIKYKLFMRTARARYA